MLITGSTTGAMYVTLDDARVELEAGGCGEEGVHVSFKVPTVSVPAIVCTAWCPPKS